MHGSASAGLVSPAVTQASSAAAAGVTPPLSKDDTQRIPIAALKPTEPFSGTQGLEHGPHEDGLIQ